MGWRRFESPLSSLEKSTVMYSDGPTVLMDAEKCPRQRTGLAEVLD